MFLVIGGDHDQGKFRVVFLTLLKISGMSEPVYKTKAITQVYCKKAAGVILDKSVMSSIDDDLQIIKANSSLLFHQIAQTKLNVSGN